MLPPYNRGLFRKDPDGPDPVKALREARRESGFCVDIQGNFFLGFLFVCLFVSFVFFFLFFNFLFIPGVFIAHLLIPSLPNLRMKQNKI